MVPRASILPPPFGSANGCIQEVHWGRADALAGSKHTLLAQPASIGYEQAAKFSSVSSTACSHHDDSDDTVSVSSEESQGRRDRRWAAGEPSKEQQSTWHVLLGRYQNVKRKLRKQGNGSKEKQKRTLNGIEVFCGCAELASQLTQVGIKTVGIDYCDNKDRPRTTSFNVDLSTKEGQDLFWQMVLDNNPDYIHFAPPCGTASRARERPLKKMPNVPLKPPRPLRSDDHPDGLPDLTPEEVKRVTTANQLYAFVANVVRLLDKRGIYWTIENPANSLFWKTSWLVHLKRCVPVRQIVFQHCMHGGDRDKKTVLWHDPRLDMVP